MYKALGGVLIIGGVLFYVHVRREAEEEEGKVEKTEP